MCQKDSVYAGGHIFLLSPVKTVMTNYRSFINNNNDDGDDNNNDNAI